MLNILRTQAWVTVATLVSFGGSALRAGDWRYFSPILSTQTRTLEHHEADSILAAFCQTRLRAVAGVGESCTTKSLGSGFSDIVDHQFHPRGVIFGHFLGPKSNDAAISGWSAETHPLHWGGTLLLTRRGDVWTPISYRSAIIIDSCRKIDLQDRREILLCENEDSGMGHALHYLYVVDFERPLQLEHSLLAKADTFEDDCVSQKQVLKGLRWRPDGQGFSVEVETTEWRRVSNESYCAKYPKGRPAALRLTFVVTSEALRKVETEPR